ncbi:MAG: LysM peptidoglycan-binding domain-containing protein [Clostridia bacterium]|nr:LysM peptidoglycan-binding domain-containing protein [Clostridia bacterium]
MKIVNKTKFIRTMSIILITLFICIIFSSNTYSNVEIGNKEIFISSGDTLWKISQNELNNNKYFENKDIREVVNIIKKTNNLKNTNVVEGQKIIIPIYK